MTDHCPACQVARELAEHRDATAPEWSVRRATLNFAAIVARQACPAPPPPAGEQAATTSGGQG